MELRNAVDIEILKAVVNVLDTNGDEPLINLSELELSADVLQFLGGHIIKLAADEGAIKGKVFNELSIVKNRVQAIVQTDDFFLDSSADITKYMFKIIKQYDAVPSCDLVIAKIMVHGVPAVAILKLDYQKSVEHDICYSDDENGFDVKLAFVERTLPLPKTKLSCGAIIQFSEEEVYDLIAVERIVKGLDGEPVEFFMKEFLQANRIVDDLDKTAMFYTSAENWIRKNIRNEMDKAIGYREDLQGIYQNSETIVVSAIAEEFIDDSEKREKFIELMEVKGFDAEEPFKIDKDFIEKKLKVKSIKTDTGFTIKSSLDIMSDSSKFEIKYNGDGTVNYIIKNVRNISQ